MMNDTAKGVKIMGVGSARDRELLESVQLAVKELGMTIDIQMVSDINVFLKMGITAIPAIVINGRIVANGRIPGVMEIKSLLRENYPAEGAAK